jgi:Zn-dependent metalloprotease
MKNKLLISLTLNIFVSFSSFSQYQHFLQYVTPYLSSPVVSGFYHINPNNSFQPGYLYQQYRLNTPDLDNQMALLDYHTDSLVGYTHYKYQQLYKNIPIEGAGCIEHFNEFNKLVYINAKLIDSIKQDAKPKIGPDEAIITLIDKLNTSARTSFAWDSPEYETQMQQDMNDSTATWYPDAKLIFAVDTFKNMTMVISGDRYKLAYAIPITFLNPFETIIYHIDANTGDVIKTIKTTCNDGPASISNYGMVNIDTEWQGGFAQNFNLKANDNGRSIHTKIANLDHPWWTIFNVTDDDDVWGTNESKETTAHYLTTKSWDFYKNYFSRNGQDNDGIPIRILSQYNSFDSFFTFGNNNNYLKFGTSDLGGYEGAEPSIVAHEFTHGVIHHSSQLGKTYESGALNEALSDIFGVVIQCKMLDQDQTDWIFGNLIATDEFNKRSFSAPKTLGTHLDLFGNKLTGQPDTYYGEFWQSDSQDSGGIHINSGVINKWFYLLSDGDSGVNDNGDFYNLSGIGMSKSMKIAYYTMTSGLLNSSQFSDAREASIEAAIELFGNCSVEHQQTVDAWYAVGIGGLNNCNTTFIAENVNNEDFKVYPNPTNSILNFELPSCSKSVITITDLSGKILELFDSSDIYFSINLDSLLSGMYMIKIDNGKQIVTKKIILNK